METKELLQITDINTIQKKYQEILGERVHSDGTHPLYLKGLFDGMEIIVKALSYSITERKKLEAATGTPDDK